uniref:uncharacterized protein LOC122780499 isoform X1 n=1 Tax=Solea senegalensis TaxID=28829 RepID=UPI001CD8614F|nr:uncharacterized protein LOC122780499 isoform X1 [Solea senegalensis]
MVDNLITKPLGLVLLATAHMVCNGPGQAEVTGTLGSNVTLQFTFNDTVVSNHSYFAIYITGLKKIAEYNSKGGIGGGVFDIYQNTSIRYHITRLKQNQSGIYWASLFLGSGLPKESNKVHLIVQSENRNNTDSPLPNNTRKIEERGSPGVFSFHIVTVLVVLSVVLLAAVLPLFTWCLMRAKDTQQQQQPQQNSNITVQQETVEEATSVSPPSLVYSVLDFPRRSPTPLHVDPYNTEYANVSYLPEKRRM